MTESDDVRAKPDNPSLLEPFDTTSGGSDPRHLSKITLRDLFAAAALLGQLSNPKWPNAGESGLPASEEECAAHWAYSFADAMLAERNK